MRQMDGEHLGANRIKLGFGKSMPTRCVWIDGVPENFTEKQLYDQFSRYGAVIHKEIDREKGHALIFYETVSTSIKDKLLTKFDSEVEMPKKCTHLICLLSDSVLNIEYLSSCIWR